MCGRYTLTVSAKTLAEAFHLAPIGFRVERHWNIAPGQYVIVIRPETDQRIADRARWGQRTITHGRCRELCPFGGQ